MASSRNWNRIERLVAPMDFSMPISRVRCVTDTNMMLARPMPPMANVSVPTKPRRICKYWNPAVADLLNSQMAENGANRERFQRYILDLAATHEQECAVMDHEAQRCRGMLAKQPNAAPKTEKK